MLRFPSSEPNRSTWARAVKLVNCIPNKTYFVCEAHFINDDYQSFFDSNVKKLKLTATPSLNLPV